MSEPKALDLTGRPRLTWPQAVEAMKAGNCVKQASQCYLRLVQPATDDELAVYESGQEGCCLIAAWTDDDKPVNVFMGACSRHPFVPEGDHFEATDWVVVDRSEA